MIQSQPKSSKSTVNGYRQHRSSWEFSSHVIPKFRGWRDFPCSLTWTSMKGYCWGSNQIQIFIYEIVTDKRVKRTACVHYSNNLHFSCNNNIRKSQSQLTLLTSVPLCVSITTSLEGAPETSTASNKREIFFEVPNLESAIHLVRASFTSSSNHLDLDECLMWACPTWFGLKLGLICLEIRNNVS